MVFEKLAQQTPFVLLPYALQGQRCVIKVLECSIGRREHGEGRRIQGAIQADGVQQVNQRSMVSAASDNVHDRAGRLHREEHCVDDVHDTVARFQVSGRDGRRARTRGLGSDGGAAHLQLPPGNVERVHVRGSSRQVGRQHGGVHGCQHVEQQDLREERHPLPAAGNLSPQFSRKSGDGRVSGGEEGEQPLAPEGVIKASNANECLKRGVSCALCDNFDDGVRAFKACRDQDGVNHMNHSVDG
eukprot:3177702-Rhodomonas_salina.1